jgi:hypothetical protein
MYSVCLFVCVFRVEQKSTDELSGMIEETKLSILKCETYVRERLASWHCSVLPPGQSRPTRSSRCRDGAWQAETKRWSVAPASWQTECRHLHIPTWPVINLVVSAWAAALHRNWNKFVGDCEHVLCALQMCGQQRQLVTVVTVGLSPVCCALEHTWVKTCAVWNTPHSGDDP